MVRRLIVISLIVVSLMLAGCGVEETPTPLPTATPGAPQVVDLAATMVYQQVAGEATQQAYTRQLEAQRAEWTVTAQAVERIEIARQAAATATMQSIAATATEAIRSERATATAQAFAVQVTQTQQAWQATATIQSAYTTATAIVLPTYAAAEAARLEAQAAIATAQVAEADLAVRRQQMKNGLDAFGPWAIVFLAILVVAGWVYFSSRLRVIERGANGLAPVVAMQTRMGLILADPENMGGAGYRIDGEVVEEMGTKDDVIRRKQAVQAIGALPPGRAPKLEVGQMFSVGNGGKVVVVGDVQRDPALDAYEEGLMEE